MKRAARATTAALLLGVAVVVVVAIALPPARLNLARPFDDGTVSGAIHVHTNRSDGRSSPEEVAEAAARAGLEFVIFTDHGDATRRPDPPSYHSGVLCLDAVEISTAGGHYLALDVPAAPYPLGGEARDVVEDVRRLGGFGIVAHPDSPKPELRWQQWDAPFDAVELVNPDTSWRRHLIEGGVRPKLRLLAALFTYPIRGDETIANLLHDSREALSQWEPITRRRRVVALAGVDAHAKLALRNVDPGDNRLAIPVPSYQAAFGALSVHVRPDRPFTGDAERDAAALMRSIRAGRLYTAANGLASPPAFEFTARNDRGDGQAGDELVDAGAVRLRVRTNAPDTFATTVWRGSEPLITSRSEYELAIDVPEGPGVYRVDIRAVDRPHQPMWLVSNPIYVRAEGSLLPTDLDPAPPAVAGRSLLDTTTMPPWGVPRWDVEHDATSRATLESLPEGFAVQYALGGGHPLAQSAALSLLTYGGVLANSTAVAFTARADRPMRLSVQVRTPERWQRSIYLDTVERRHVLRFDEFRPVGATATSRPPVADLHSVMWVVDTTNTRPGAEGRFWIGNVVSVD